MEHARNMTLPNDQAAGICLNTFGISVTQPGHTYGPAVRSYHLIHFILEGEGTFQMDRRRYHLHAGQGFLIEPDYLTTYRSSTVRPWTYLWIGFGGHRSSAVITSLGLSADNPIFSCTAAEGRRLRGYIEDMLRRNGYAASDDAYYRLGLFFELLSVLAHAQRERLLPAGDNSYLSHIIGYIRTHIEEPFSIQQLADYMGLSRSYLTMLFKKKMNVSLHHYIQNCRLTKAQHLLETTRLSVDTISYSCGYANYDSFTRAFKRQFQISPSTYRKQRRQLALPEQDPSPGKEDSGPLVSL